MRFGQLLGQARHVALSKPHAHIHTYMHIYIHIYGMPHVNATAFFGVIKIGTTTKRLSTMRLVVACNTSG